MQPQVPHIGDALDPQRAQVGSELPIQVVWKPRRVAEVPEGEVWVHCAGGYRASVAASFLAAARRELVAIDDSFDNAESAGLHLVTNETKGER